MVTMMKEKVNTHFSFPLRLDMAPYTEKHLIRKERLQGNVSLCHHILSQDFFSGENYISLRYYGVYGHVCSSAAAH